MWRNLRSYRVFFLVVIALFLSETSSAQFDVPPRPSIEEQTSLYDYINLLNANQQNALEKKLLNYADSTSTQIVVAIISSTKGEDISLLGAKWGQAWGVGQAQEDNGIFIILAKDDRMVDINTGYGIEMIITDRMAERIINRVMIPEFKKGSYYNGLDQGADAIFSALNGEFEEDRDFKEDKFPTRIVLIILFILIWFALSRRKKGRGGKGGGSRGPSIWDVIVLSNMGRTGGSSSGGSFGGGSFGGGFGGGGFGGGGASGGW